MKKFLAFCSIPAALLAVTVACDSGSNVVDCTTDDDCADLADTPVCDPDEGFCVADTSECAADLDCQIAYNAGDDASAACTADSECDTAAAEICAAGFNGEGFCVASDDGTTACTDAGGVVVTVDKVEGGTADACLDPVADRSCGDDGVCTVQ